MPNDDAKIEGAKEALASANDFTKSAEAEAAGKDYERRMPDKFAGQPKMETMKKYIPPANHYSIPRAARVIGEK